MLATQSGSRECGGYARFRIDEHGNTIVTDMKPIRQHSTSGFFEISARDNALFLEELVAAGEDPAEWSMLFHTHPTGMDAKMSGTDIKMLREMAEDLPGTIVRSMILAQEKMYPLVHEAVCIEGRVMFRENIAMTLLDETKAIADLREIGWFDKPKQEVTKWSSGDWKQSQQVGGGWLPGSNDGWYDETPVKSEAKTDGETALGEWLREAEKERGQEEELETDKERAKDYIGLEVMHEGMGHKVCDAYPMFGLVVLTLDSGKEVYEDEVEFVGGLL
jgi:proteasome lid subunit RPN8/RPN11